MGVDYYNCEICDEIFHDCGHYGYCGNCESIMCGHCYDEMAEKYGELGEEHINADDYGEEAPASCDKCCGVIIDEHDFANFLVAKIGKSRAELEEEFHEINQKPSGPSNE